MSAPEVRIHYLRPPDREQVYVQRLVHEDASVVVSLLDGPAIARSLEIAGEPVLEPGSAIVWFTFPGERHDVGRFHLADGTFTGLYADVLEPVVRLGPLAWKAVDLFLDVWLPARGGVHLLDEDELEDALERGWVTTATAAAARAEAARLIELAHAGEWPPPIVSEWTLVRARAAVASAT